MTARVAGDLPLPEVDLHQALTGVDIHPLSHILVQHRVVMLLLELDVVIDIDPATADLDVLIGVFGQSPQCGLVEPLEGLLPVARQPPERPAVQVVQQGPDALIQVSQGEEGVVA